MSLPVGYRQVEYLESSGTQYINTGFTPTNTTKVDVDVALLGFSGTGNVSHWCCVFNSGSPRYGLFFGYDQSQSFAGTIQLGWGSGFTNILHTFSEQTRFNAVVENASIYINGDLIGSATADTFTAGSTLQIFRSKSGESARVYKCKVYDNGTLVRDLIPCVNSSDVAGLYDLVNDVFYQNAGTGTFTVGPIIVGNATHLTPMFLTSGSPLPQGYIQLDYIENPDQNAYINTGIIPDDTTGFKVRMSVKNTNADLYYLGARESLNDSRFGLGVYQGHTYMALGTYYSDVNNWTITTNTPFVAENNYKNSRVATMNGLNPVSVGSLSGITFTRSIYLFKSNLPTLQITSNCRIYDCEITQGTTVVAHFIPCFDDNGVACMYDTIRKQTFYSAGSSDFITNYVPPITIPAGYTLLDYLESDGTGQYIDTGYIATQTTNIECDFMITQHNSNLLNYVYGEYISGKACAIYISSNYNYGILYGNVDRNTNISRVFNEKVHSILNSDNLIINETTETVGYNGTYTAPYTLYLFKGNGSSRPGMIGRIYYMLIREARGVVSRYLVPCLDDQNVPCMYDVITKQTYYNAGTGALIAGVPVDDYTPVEYIESSGTQFINTGFTPNQNTKVSLTVQKEVGSASNIFGSRVSNQSQAFTFQISSGDYQFISGYGSRTERSNVVNDGQVHTLMRDKGYFYVDGVLKFSQTSPDFTCPANAYLFTMYNNATPTAGTPMKLYNCKIWDNGTLVRDFVPCVRNSDSKPGLYDIVNKVFYTNDGTGEFTYPEITTTSGTSSNSLQALIPTRFKAAFLSLSPLPVGYKQVEYIESDGNQYIDTGLKGGLDTFGVETKVYINNSAYYYVLGNFNQTGQCGLMRRTSDTTQVIFIYYVNSNPTVVNLGTVNSEIVFSNKNNQIISNGVVKDTMPNTTTKKQNSNLCLFGTGIGTQFDASGKVYYLKIYSDLTQTNLIMDLIPCLDNNNVPCLYDTVTKQTMYNSGSGTFAYGTIITPQEIILMTLN